MDDKEKPTPEKPEVPVEDNGERSEPKADAEIKRINEDTERINKAIAENENAKARARASGVADAGEVVKPETEDEKWAREAKVRYAGTGMCPAD